MQLLPLSEYLLLMQALPGFLLPFLFLLQAVLPAEVHLLQLIPVLAEQNRLLRQEAVFLPDIQEEVRLLLQILLLVEYNCLQLHFSARQEFRLLAVLPVRFLPEGELLKGFLLFLLLKLLLPVLQYPEQRQFLLFQLQFQCRHFQRFRQIHRVRQQGTVLQ